MRESIRRADALLIDAALFLLFLIGLALAWAWREA